MKWTEENEQKIAELLTNEYRQANSIICKARRCKYMEIIDVKGSVDGVIKQIKQILDV